MEIFHEDILQTFIFCFLASLGIIQIMVGKRGWHGLSIYGGRVNKKANYVIGAALVILSYAWYFSNPEHRNTRNIEGFMSLACLILGIIAAAVATAALASACDALRRRRGRGAAAGEKGRLRTISLPDGTALLSPDWGAPGENLVVFAEPGRGNERVLNRLQAALPRGRGLLSLHPFPYIRHESFGDFATKRRERVTGMLSQIEEMEGLRLEGETFMGLGWGSGDLILLRAELEDVCHPRVLLAVAPVIPDYSRGLIGDALLSNTPLDICDTLAREKPWMEGDFKRLLAIWWPVLTACVILATLATFAFDIRWKLFSGPLAGLILSLWIAYFLAARRGAAKKDGGREMETVSAMRSFYPTSGDSPLRVVVTSEDCASIATLPEEAKPVDSPAHLELWTDVLRGKFLLKKGTLSRLGNLIQGEERGRPEQG